MEVYNPAWKRNSRQRTGCITSVVEVRAAQPGARQSRADAILGGDKGQREGQVRLGHITESGRLPTTGGGRRLGEIALKIESKFEKIFVLKRYPLI